MMYKKTVNLIFILVFMLLCTVPLAFSNLVQGTPSEAENRMLHGIAKVYKNDGSFNPEVLNEFNGWINDNIGFRSQIVALNAQIQFYIFNRFTHNSNLSLGPNDEINSTPSQQILEYQHLNLKSEEELVDIAAAFQTISDYLEDKGIQYYYIQCYEKYSIYPEHMSVHINQYGDVSKTDQIVNVLEERTDIRFVAIKDKLIDAKSEYQTYSRFGDAAHWTQRGAVIGYRALMEEINKYNDNIFPILEEDDYHINLTDQGADLFGGIHLIDYLEEFIIKEQSAYETNHKLREEERQISASFYTNDSVDNRVRVLVFSDSYFNLFILDDLSQSFYETVCIHADNTKDFVELIEYYQPDIVIHENAERVDRYDIIIKVAEAIHAGG